MVEARGGRARIVEVPKEVSVLEREGRDAKQRGGADYDHDRSDPGVHALVIDPARGDALVDDVRLLEEQLPWGDRRADHRDDQQDRGGGRAARDRGDHEVTGDLADTRVRHEEQRDHEKVRGYEHEHPALPGAEATADGQPDQGARGEWDREVLGDAEISKRETHADELRHDRQEVQDEQVTDREPTPEAPKALVDQSGMTYARDGAEAHDHLLIDNQDRDEQEQHPQEARAVVLTGLRVGGDAAGVVVADHDDEPGADDREQRHPARAQSTPTLLVLADRAKGTANIADVRGVEHRALARRGSLSRRRRRRIACHLLGLLKARSQLPWRPPGGPATGIRFRPARERPRRQPRSSYFAEARCLDIRSGRPYA